ncbi:uncharacterized protein LOC106130379 [Amyelois transitella]|uniref:uncharacterized protein LOC106130379 n=1 Tax=Amyelois transitella TaxID=680683 RepID=UPI0029900F85|nr:uncharacterized protein LOC106130379 [Amyelois transitella]
MRNERSEPKKTKHTKVLFKKSDLTVARSSIFSDASQRYTKSAIRRIKRELQRDDYYTYKGKLKRDLSLETDNCILRRYCKKKLTSLASSAKTKYSNFYAVDNETVEEFEDSSGSGDNKKSALDNDNSFNADVTILMMENLKHHLNVWVEKHLTDDKDIKRKFNNVLDSILYRLYMEDANNYSHTNYSLERDNKIPQGKAGTSSVFHNNTTKTFPTIIPLLDGAASKAKYIFESKNSTTGNSITSCYNSKIEHDTVTSRDIIELKEIVKNISQTAENLVYEHMKRKLESFKVKTESKEVQTSAPKVPVTGFSGLKLIKEPKRTDSPKKSLKKSASYNIIESESILRVTDMTVGEANVESKQ